MSTQAVRSLWPAWFGLASLLVALYVAAGIRAYYAFLMWSSLAAAFVLFVVRWDASRLRRAVPLAVGILTLAGLSYREGADVYETLARYRRGAVAAEGSALLPERVEALVRGATGAVVRARAGFERTGGGTALAGDERTTAPAVGTGPPRAPRVKPAGEAALAAPVPVRVPEERLRQPETVAATGDGVMTHVRRLLRGLAALFVPISLLQAWSIVEMPGGRNLLFLTDIDTVFIDFTIVTIFVLLLTRWQVVRRQLPYLCFMLVLACTTTGLLAYVVTNFGTLFRLRLLMAVPFWLLVFATSSARLTPDPQAAEPAADTRACPPARADSIG